jgi:hypothetical protein
MPATGSPPAPPEPEPIATGLAGPLQLDVGHRGQIYVGQSFAGLLSRIGAGGNVVNLTSETASVEGVASRRWAVAYTTRAGDNPSNLVSELKLRKPDGTVRTIADLAAYEAAHNPDQLQRYGFRNLDAECLAQLPPDLPLAPYTGQIDSHAYALAKTKGGWFVADAGANAILKVTRSGKVSTYFVFRPQKAVVTAEAAAGLGLPDCTVGATFAFEAVPTDVEVNAQGFLIVSLLPGGPEDATLGARGSLVRIGGDGEYSNLATGFLGATNLAIAPHGRIYVSEIFGNQISVYHQGSVTPVLSVPSPAGLEYHRGALIASTDVFGAGNIVSIRP